jgi:hypothetical protein
MRRKFTIAVGGLAIAGLGGFAAIGLAGGGTGTPAASTLVNGYESPDVAVHRVGAPSPGADASAVARATARKRAKQVRIAYFETGRFPIAEGAAIGQALPCRGNRRALGGYFANDGVDVALTFSAPETGKRWFVGITNLTGIEPAATQAILGVVCAKGAK